MSMKFWIGNQVPGTEEEIAAFCDSRYGITFPQFSKIEVNGNNAAPLYQFLKKQKGFAGFSEEHPLTPLMESVAERNDPDYKNNAEIKWNFTKFLIDRNGNVIERFEPTEDMVTVAHKVEALLEQKVTESKKIEYQYQTQHTCSQNIQFELDGNIVTNIQFTGGCNGNLKAISALVDGWTVEQIEEKCKGITCGRRPTSCSDQLAQAVREAYNKSFA